MCLAGVRYPAQLLGDVVATLSKAQELISGQGQAETSSTLQSSTLRAAAMGAGGAIRSEAPTPIDRKSLAKALRYSVDPYSTRHIDTLTSHESKFLEFSRDQIAHPIEQ